MKSIISGAVILLTGIVYGQNNEIKNLSLPPVSTFAGACARCHGDEGKNYGSGFAKLEDEELHKVVEDMMYGPAYLEPSQTDIDAMTSYQKAISNDEPFIVVVNAESFLNGSEKTLKVETSLNSQIQPGDLYSLKQGDKKYRYELIPHKEGKIKMAAKRGEKVTELSFPDEIWSHSK